MVKIGKVPHKQRIHFPSPLEKVPEGRMRSEEGTNDQRPKGDNVRRGQNSKHDIESTPKSRKSRN